MKGCGPGADCAFQSSSLQAGGDDVSSRHCLVPWQVERLVRQFSPPGLVASRYFWEDKTQTYNPSHLIQTQAVA